MDSAPACFKMLPGVIINIFDFFVSEDLRFARFLFYRIKYSSTVYFYFLKDILRDHFRIYSII